MAYTYGMQGAPAVGHGAPGLPRRSEGQSDSRITSATRAMAFGKTYFSTVFDPVSDAHYCSCSGGLIWKIGSDGIVQWSIVIDGRATYTTECKWGSGGVKVFNVNTVISISPSGSVEWAVSVAAEDNHTISMLQSDTLGNTYVFSRKALSSPYLYVTMLNQSGGLVWSRQLLFSSSAGVTFTDAACGPGGAVYCTYNGSASTQSRIYVSRVDTYNSGTHNYASEADSDYNLTSGSIAVGSDGVVYTNHYFINGEPYFYRFSADLQTRLSVIKYSPVAGSGYWRSAKLVPVSASRFAAVGPIGLTSPNTLGVGLFDVDGSNAINMVACYQSNVSWVTSDLLSSANASLDNDGNLWLSTRNGSMLRMDLSFQKLDYSSLILPGPFKLSAFTLSVKPTGLTSLSSSTGTSGAAYAMPYSAATIGFTTLSRDSRETPRVISDTFGTASLTAIAQIV